MCVCVYVSVYVCAYVCACMCACRSSNSLNIVRCGNVCVCVCVFVWCLSAEVRPHTCTWMHMRVVRHVCISVFCLLPCVQTLRVGQHVCNVYVAHTDRMCRASFGIFPTTRRQDQWALALADSEAHPPSVCVFLCVCVCVCVCVFVCVCV